MNDEQVGRSRETLNKSVLNRAGMAVRVFPAWATQSLHRISAKAEVVQFKRRMLARKHERRRKPALGERVRDRCHLDRFRPGADDQPDVGRTQYSP